MIGETIAIATLAGGVFLVKPFAFIAGYGIGFYIANINKTVHTKLATGGGTLFQNRVENIAVVLLFVLMFCIAGPFFIGMNWRMIWLGAFLATGLHFFVFYFVHGTSLLFIGVFTSITALVGMATATPFIYLGLIDGFIKIGFGMYLLFLSKPSVIRV